MNSRNLVAIFGKKIFLGLWLVLTVFPLYWVFVTSFKPASEIFTNSPSYWPRNWSFESYQKLFDYSNFGAYIANSLLTALAASVIVLIIAMLSGYVLARFSFAGRGAITLAFLCTQMIPGFIALGPLYLLMSQLNLLNSRSGLILLYVGMLIPFSAIMLRGFFERVPPALEEAAMLDGCGRFKTLFLVIAPTVLPGIAATFIFAFVACWNELFLAVIMINDDLKATIPVGMNAFVGQYTIDWAAMSAGAVVAVLPTLVLFAFARRFIIEGLTAGSIKD